MEEPESVAASDVGSEAPTPGSPLSTTQTVFLWLTVWPTAFALILLVMAGFGELGLEGAASWVLAVVLMIGVWSAARWSWAFLRRGRFRAGVVVGALGWVYGPLYGVAALVLLAAGGTCSDIDFDHLTDRLEEEPAQLTSEGFAPSPSGGALLQKALRDSRFEDCVDELYDRHDANSKVDETIRSMRNVSVTSAQAVVYDTIVDVCLHHADSPARDLGPYFGRALSNARTDRWKEAVKFDACSLEEYRPDPWAGHDNSLLDIRRAMCRLEPREAAALQLKAQGHTNQEIAPVLGISASATGNLISSARDSLANELNRRRKRLR